MPSTQDEIFDLLVVGAGPTGLSCAIEAQKAGLRAVVVDKGCVCNSLFHYPAHMTFFTTPELLEIGGIPFSSTNPKPNRNEALQYYRHVAAYYRLDVRVYHRVERVTGADGAFTVHTLDRFGRSGKIQARKLVIATGYYDLPNYLHIPGESLSKVHHYYFDPHPESEMHSHVKYWIKPDIENRIKNRDIKAYFRSEVIEINPDTVVIETPQGRETIKNDFVFAMTGYHPDFEFLESMGVRLEGEDRLPVCDPKTKESNVPGIYLAGVIVAGSRTNEIFIENGRFHGQLIAQALTGK